MNMKKQIGISFELIQASEKERQIRLDKVFDILFEAALTIEPNLRKEKLITSFK